MRRSATVLVWFSALLGTRIARADCTPTAVPIGDPAVVGPLTEKLTANGIATSPAANCPVVRVNVEQRGPELHLKVVDAYQRLGERDVHDVATAAAVIESWTLQEIERGNLPAEPAPAPVASVSAIAVPAARPSLSLSAAGRTSVGSDGSTWVGGAVQGCRRIGWACAGGLLAIASDTTAVDDVTTGSHRSLAIDALATLDVPRSLGGFTISPGIALGYGWNRIEEQHLDVHAMPLEASHANHSLRAGARVAIARPIARSFAIYGELFGDVATLRTAIPDGPRARTGVSLGVRVGAP